MIVVKIWQGLGNQLFQYAFAKSCAVHTGKTVYLDTSTKFDNNMQLKMGSAIHRDIGINHFNISVPIIPEKKLCMWDYITLEKGTHYIISKLEKEGIYPFHYQTQKEQKDISIPIPKFSEIRNNTYLKGWFQTSEYFEDIRTEIMSDLSLKNEMDVSESIEDIISDSKSVSLHIRRGDYKLSSLLLDKNYYELAINMIKKHISNPQFVVFSDEIDWVKENINIPGDPVFIDRTLGLEDYEELILMSKCKNNIIANSTFSWWGAWLNQNDDKIVVAPDKWFANQSNIVPKEWIKIE